MNIGDFFRSGGGGEVLADILFRLFQRAGGFRLDAGDAQEHRAEGTFDHRRYAAILLDGESGIGNRLVGDGILGEFAERDVRRGLALILHHLVISGVAEADLFGGGFGHFLFREGQLLHRAAAGGAEAVLVAVVIISDLGVGDGGLIGNVRRFQLHIGELAELGRAVFRLVGLEPGREHIVARRLDRRNDGVRKNDVVDRALFITILLQRIHQHLRCGKTIGDGFNDLASDGNLAAFLDIVVFAEAGIAQALAEEITVELAVD
ncbi:hypothetical protein D3C72_1305860 [compost metagenome]